MGGYRCTQFKNNVSIQPVTMNNTSALSSFRKQALNLIDPLIQPLPPVPSVAFVWPTESCSIGCSHCSYNSKKQRGNTANTIINYPAELVKWLANAGVKRLVVCGGGEPLDEPDFLSNAILQSAIHGLDFEIYTSGVSFSKPFAIKEYIANWQQQWKHKRKEGQRFNIRLSLDAFHEELIGLQPLVDWINAIHYLAPDWTVSIRSVRLEGDNSVQRLADQLKGKLEKKNNSSGSILLPDGKKIIVQWKGFVFEGRGQFKQLERLGLKLYADDEEVIAPHKNNWNEKNELGRPLSLHHAVSFYRIDLEIHANCEVHILQSQATDLRMKFTEFSWEQIKSNYYRDPLLHCTVENGLSGIAALLADYRKANPDGRGSIPFSIESITDPDMLSWITARAILTNGKGFSYSQGLKNQAIAHLRLYED